MLGVMIRITGLAKTGDFPKYAFFFRVSVFLASAVEIQFYELGPGFSTSAMARATSTDCGPLISV